MDRTKTVKGINVFTNQPMEYTIEDGAIVSAETLSSADGLPYVSPGFFDIQVNGYHGNDYSSPDITDADITNIIDSLAASGTTRHFATLVTASSQQMQHTLSVLHNTLDQQPRLASAVPGIHIEGPFISHEDGPRGAHAKQHVRNPSIAEYHEWQQVSGNRIKLVTLAPERAGSAEFIQDVSASGVRVALGHTMADPESIRSAVDAGAALSTHLGNGSHAMIPRLKNYIWEQLANDSLYASIITDGYHLPDSVIKVFWRAKGKDRIMITSDVAVMGGYPPGRYAWGDITVEVCNDGSLRVADTEYLAGASLLLDVSIPRLIHAAGCTLAEAVASCTVRPAGFFGFPDSSWDLSVGAPAHMTVFHWKAGDMRLQIERTVRDGITVFAR